MGFATIISQVIFVFLFILLVIHIFELQQQQYQMQQEITNFQKDFLSSAINTDFEILNVSYIASDNITKIEMQNIGAQQLSSSDMTLYIGSTLYTNFSLLNCYNITRVTCGEIGKNDYAFETENLSLLYHGNFNANYGENLATINDFAANNDGTLTNVTAATGKFSQALSFDGTQSYVHVPNDPTLSFTTTSNYSWSFWVNPKSASGTLYSKSDGTGGYSFDILNQYFIVKSINNNATLNSTARIPQGTWTHIAITFENESTTIYVNGVQEIQTTVNDFLSDSSSAINIGRYVASANDYYNGLIDEIAQYNQVLTAHEVKTLYLKGKELVNPGIWDSQEYTTVYIQDNLISNTYQISINANRKRQIATMEVI